MLRFIIILSVFVTVLSQNEDSNAIKAAILDYVEGIYNVEESRIEKSVDPTLRKYGYWFDKRISDYRQGQEMNYKQLYRLAETWNKKGKVDAKKAKKEITILDQQDKTASAKLIAHWGLDYFHLVKEGGKWKIINVLWQSLPMKKKTN